MNIYSGGDLMAISKIILNGVTQMDVTQNTVASNNLLDDYIATGADGNQVIGSVINNGATGGTIATQGGTYTIPAGYTSGGTVTAFIPASTITNSVLNLQSIEEISGDYGVQASITIPAGYYNQTTLTKTLSTILPAPSTAAAAPQMLAAYQAYNNEGQLLTGTMTNREDWGATLNDSTTSVTIPAGYHDGTGIVNHTTVNIPDPTISVSASGLITASGTWTKGFTTDNSYSNTQQLSTQGAITVTPSNVEQTIVTAGKYTTGAIKVAAISSDYMGDNVVQRDSTDLTVSGATITAPAGYYANDALASVATGSVTAPASISGTTASLTAGTNTITLAKTVSVTPNVTTAGYISNGTAGNSSISLTANVPTQAATTITPTDVEQTAVSSGVYTKGAIKVAAIPSDYIGSDIISRSSSDLTVSGATVSVPAGYYASNTSKSVATATHLNPSVSINTSNGLISASHTQAAGYVSAGTTSDTLQLTTKAGTTITPTEDEQTAVEANVYTLGLVKIGAIPNDYVGSGITTRSSSSLTASGATVTVPAGYYPTQMTKSVTTTTQASPTASINTSTGLITATHTQTAGYVTAGTKTGTLQLTVKGATTYTPGTTSQTISANQYLTGAQTIAGDVDLIAANIKSGVQIFGVTGTYAGLDTSDATAAAADIVSGKTAYVDGREVEGSLVVQTYYTGSTAPSSSLGINGDIYLQS